MIKEHKEIKHISWTTARYESSNIFPRARGRKVSTGTVVRAAGSRDTVCPE